MGYFVYMDLKYIETYVFVFIYGIKFFFFLVGKLDVFMKLKCIGIHKTCLFVYMELKCIEIVGIGL